MAYTITRNGAAEALDYGAFHDDQGVKHPANVLDLWSDAELLAVGVVRVPDPPPPPPPRRELPKSTVQERLNTIGKLGAAFSLLNADPISFGRWFAPDWPKVYCDDAGLLTVLAAAGCTADEIATITA